ncbi:MAG: GNAT family N-acetyltransferase [Opitutales bacterium]
MGRGQGRGKRGGLFAQDFPRRGTMELLALASVCTHPDFRCRGLGTELVRRILSLVDEGKYPAAFWQTGVPGFYEKLGARLVTNRVRNSRHPLDPEKNPFWDPFLMIYPADAVWPEGAIDLNGLGY